MSNGGDSNGQVGTSSSVPTMHTLPVPAFDQKNAGSAAVGQGLAGLMNGANTNYVPGFSKFDPAKDLAYRNQQTAGQLTQQPYQPPTTGDPNTNTVNNAPATTPMSQNGQTNFNNALNFGRLNNMRMQEQGSIMQAPNANGPGGKPGGLPQGGGQPMYQQRAMAGGGLVSFADGGMMRPRAHHPHEHALGLAALGRHGDSTLVHMSPSEVGGLQKLAMATGGSLTTNPQTGLPEAGWLSSILPMVAGGVLAATGVGAPAAAAIVAAEEGIRQKDWKKGLMAGLGAYGGAGLGGALTGAGEAAGEGAASAAGESAAKAAATSAADSSAAGLAASNPALASGMQAATEAGTAAGSSAMGYATPSMQALAAQQAASPLAASAAQEAAFTPAATAGAAMPSTMGTAPTFANNMSNMGKGIAGLTQKGGINAVAQQGVGRGTLMMAAAPALYSAAYPDPVKPPPTAGTEYYIPAPGYKSLYNPGTINPAIAKYGYLPTGQSALIGQGWNPGVYSSTLPGYNGAPSSQFTGNGILAGLMRRMQDQQTPNLSGYAEGGLTSGPGDGTSDSIPAMINGNQPAAIAEGEFIVPARIVSEIGNGSTKAGAQRLYEMMHKIEANRKRVSMAGDSKAARLLPK